jgi:hypothetical protein
MGIGMGMVGADTGTGIGMLIKLSGVPRPRSGFTGGGI